MLLDDDWWLESNLYDVFWLNLAGFGEPTSKGRVSEKEGKGMGEEREGMGETTCEKCETYVLQYSQSTKDSLN